MSTTPRRCQTAKDKRRRPEETARELSAVLTSSSHEPTDVFHKALRRRTLTSPKPKDKIVGRHKGCGGRVKQTWHWHSTATIIGPGSVKQGHWVYQLICQKCGAVIAGQEYLDPLAKSKKRH